MKKKSLTYNTHLSLEDRIIIQKGIENGSTKKAIAQTIGKDNSTVGKEIKCHRLDKGCRSFNNIIDFNTCNRRDRTPCACNGCEKYTRCNIQRYFYDALKAQKQYELSLSGSREGILLSSNDIARIGRLIAPLINKKQSIDHIMMNHKNEIPVSAKTLYRYIDQGVFREYGIINLSLKESVVRKQRKTKSKPRKSPANYAGHTYNDFLFFKQANPDQLTTEMDTLYNSPSGPYIQTLMLTNCRVMIGFIHDSKTSMSMAQSLQSLYSQLGHDLYSTLFGLLLTDRGSEFEIHSLFEFRDDTRIGCVYYCDPMCAHQKPLVENNHNYVRDIIPNGMDITNLSQEDIHHMFLHINNTPRRSLGGRTPIDMLEIYYPDDFQRIMDVFKLKRIHPDTVTLNSSLVR